MRRMLWLAVMIAALGCDDSGGPGGVADARLMIVLQDSLAPPLMTTQDSFWVRVGDDRDLRLYYEGAQPGDTGEEFLRFEVPSDGLYQKPDGSAFGPNDSLLVTVKVVDPSRFLFDFAPDGLRFHPSHPARLRVRYLHGEKDFDGDGDEDSDDGDIEAFLDLWHRTGPGALWYKMGGVKFEDLDEIDANILSFSQYAVAW